ncbi:MAG: hypothetical protein LBN33_04010 [Desulfovibrio sp.]|nr:hypothetical protein [Desulfovibrio sp.]
MAEIRKKSGKTAVVLLAALVLGLFVCACAETQTTVRGRYDVSIGYGRGLER